MTNKPFRPWTEAETALARELVPTDISPEEFRARVGRTKESARARLNYLDDPEYRVKSAARRRRHLDPDYVAPMPPVPPDVIAEAARRANAPLSLTAVLCGDPPAGRPWPDGRTASEVRA